MITIKYKKNLFFKTFIHLFLFIYSYSFILIHLFLFIYSKSFILNHLF